MISQKQNAQSQFVTYLSVKDSSTVNQKLIEPKVKKFFAAKNITEQKPIDADKAISDLDFKTVDFSYFYDAIFYDIAKNKEGKIEIPVKYCITLDKEICKKQCKETQIFYEEILLYNQPVFYFIYVDIVEIFAFLRANNQ